MYAMLINWRFKEQTLTIGQRLLESGGVGVMSFR